MPAKIDAVRPNTRFILKTNINPFSLNQDENKAFELEAST